MNRIADGFCSLIIGFYAWISAVFLGAILLDIVYSNSLTDFLGVSERTALFSAVSDFLLLIGFLVVLAGAGAIVASWKSPVARYFFPRQSGNHPF
jgi:hypothetical protein